jgi:hypothetical protein
MKFVLRFTPGHTDGIGRWAPNQGPYFLVRLGAQWPSDPRYRLIHETTLDRSNAREFASEEDARATWAEAGSPAGWEVVENGADQPRPREQSL